MVSNRRFVTVDGPDFYPTPDWGTLALLQYVKFRGSILEPCCGDGAMAKILHRETGLPVHASDIVDRGFGRKKDFLEIHKSVVNIVTNPPFNVAEELLTHALHLAQDKVCFLLRLAFLESRRRYNLFYRDMPPTRLLVFSERLSMYPKGHEIKGGGTTSYAWFIWDKKDRFIPDTIITWIKPGLKNKVKEEE